LCSFNDFEAIFFSHIIACFQSHAQQSALFPQYNAFGFSTPFYCTEASMETKKATEVLPISEQKSYDEKPQLDFQDVSSITDIPVLTEQQRRVEKRLVRKLDCTLMPVIWTLYLFNYLDRNNIA
jgi:hypothetical protein